MPSLQPEAFRRRHSNHNIEELMNFFQAPGKFYSWEMPIIAIRYHLPRLKKVVVLTSQGKSGSDKDNDLFQQMIDKVYPDRKFELLFKKGIDFEDVKVVFDTIDQTYIELKEKGIKEKDILIDITGGQKPNSIAGALATYVVDRKFQYISTKNKCVKAYDVVPVKEERKERA